MAFNGCAFPSQLSLQVTVADTAKNLLKIVVVIIEKKYCIFHDVW